ncbi:hypothetical protein PspLS_09751 [Pyricularia sp. CBS 133598]|nr:hypothetical protein PspLS_09751 [Pyricularia sp. CBS 133598]
MQSFLITLLLAPVAVLSLTTVVGLPTTGPQCCDKGTPEPTLLCHNASLNAFCCSDARNSDIGGCDSQEIFKIGRSVKLFVADGSCKRQTAQGDTVVGFVGCA